MSDVGISFTVKASGMEAYQNRLRNINKNVSDLEAPMREAGEIAKALVRSYPPYGNWQAGQVSFIERYPGAKYKRTRTLQRGWKGQLRMGSRVLYTYRVYNYTTIEAKRDKPYLKYVQGDEQTVPHIGRWYVADQMKNMLEGEVTRIFVSFMHKAVR